MSLKTDYLLHIEEGYLMIPALGISTMKPASNFTKTVYVSMYRELEDGSRCFMAQDVPHAENISAIITCNGGIVTAKSRKRPWVDLGDRDHYCEECQTTGSKCEACAEAGGCAAGRDDQATGELVSSVSEDLEKLREDLGTLRGTVTEGLRDDVSEMVEDCHKLGDSLATFKNKMNI